MYQKIAAAGYALALLVLVSATAHAQYRITPQYMIGIDGRSDSTGAYLGLPNPNYGRLSFLYAHTYGPGDTNPSSSNHFHRIGAYAYTGPNQGASTATTYTNNFLPEGGVNRLELKNSGGYYVSGLDTNSSYEGLSITSLDRIEPTALSNPTSPEGYLYYSSPNPNSSANPGQPRYAALNSQLIGRTLALELVSRSSDLQIGASAGLSLLTNPGDRYVLGNTTDLASNPFLPVFWSNINPTDTEQHLGATFKLVDLSPNNALPESGEFTFQFRVAAAPEPGSLALGLLALPALILVVRRRNRGGYGV